MQLRRAGGHDETIQMLLLDILDHLLLGGIRAGEHRGLGHDHARLGLHMGDDLVHVHVVGDVPATVTDIDANSSFAHAGVLTLSRCAATWATAAPACRMLSGM